MRIQKPCWASKFSNAQLFYYNNGNLILDTQLFYNDNRNRNSLSPNRVAFRNLNAQLLYTNDFYNDNGKRKLRVQKICVSQ